MGDIPNMKTISNQKPKSSYLKLTNKKDISMNLEDTISACLHIINNILSYTNTLEPQDSSFDYNMKQDTETDSDSDEKESEDFIDIEHYLIHCINYLGMDKTLLILSMMTFDKLLQQNPNFIFSGKNCHK